MGIVQCANCKAEIDENAKVCPQCGRDCSPFSCLTGCAGCLIPLVGGVAIIGILFHREFYEVWFFLTHSH